MSQISAEIYGTLEVSVEGASSTITVEIGTPGPAASVTVGTTTTLSPGASATVTNVGSTAAAVLNFGIPAGQTGATGATGATGPGVPIGGTDGQVLAKIDTTDYNTTWVTPFALQVRNQVRNETGAQLDKGTVVYVNGAAGNKVTVTKAQANTDATSAQTFAVLLENIPNNQNGYAVTSGLLENLDTSAYAAGTQVYLSPTTAGTYTSTKPSAPDHLVYVGVIERSHANQGTMLVRIQNGYELDELHDVAIASKTNNDLLAYESSTNLWKNKSAATLGLATTAASDAAYLAKASNLSDLANASTARTNLGLGTAAVEPATKLVPSGGTTGQVLSKASATSWDLTWATAGGGGGGVNIQTFGSSTTSGTFSDASGWQKPSGAKVVEIILFGGGSGGGSGARHATTSGRSGGSGGGGGCIFWGKINADFLNATETVVVGAGGAGGASITTDTTNGSPGVAGGNTTFSIFQSGTSNFGSGGTTTTVSGGFGKSHLLNNIGTTFGNGGAGNIAAGSNATSQLNGSNMFPTGAGGGAGQAANTTLSTAGGNGGSFNLATVGIRSAIAGGTGGLTNGTAPTAGTSATTQYLQGGTSGGGGAYRTALAGMAGAAGGWPGGSGGGGSASDNGFASGAGGSGANGFAIIITYT